jgi:hypothetical protein
MLRIGVAELHSGRNDGEHGLLHKDEAARPFAYGFESPRPALKARAWVGRIGVDSPVYYAGFQNIHPLHIPRRVDAAPLQRDNISMTKPAACPRSIGIAHVVSRCFTTADARLTHQSRSMLVLSRYLRWTAETAFRIVPVPYGSSDRLRCRIGKRLQFGPLTSSPRNDEPNPMLYRMVIWRLWHFADESRRARQSAKRIILRAGLVRRVVWQPESPETNHPRGP